MPTPRELRILKGQSDPTTQGGADAPNDIAHEVAPPLKVKIASLNVATGDAVSSARKRDEKDPYVTCVDPVDDDASHAGLERNCDSKPRGRKGASPTPAASE